MSDERWPALDYAAWGDTRAALHLFTQMVGKVRLARSPWLNHSWHVPLYLSASGLTTGMMPLEPGRGFEIEFDFLDDALLIRVSDGGRARLALGPGTVADFYTAFMDALASVDAATALWPVPSEFPEPTPFLEDHLPRPWDGDAVRRFWQASLSVQEVFERFRARYLGKCSPVHFFWGGFDLAVTRFSGRRAPRHRGGIPGLPDWITREAYSHEVSSVGFWPGSAEAPTPIFYSYAYPEPPGFSTARVSPPEAFWHGELGEFVLPYDAVRLAERPEGALMSFCHTTWEAASDLGGWDRRELVVPEGWPQRSD